MFNWRIVFGVCSLVYMAVMMYLSVNNFAMVHREHRRIVKQLQPAQIEKVALQELVERCRKESESLAAHQTVMNKPVFTGEDPCLTWPAADLEERQNAVKERLEKKKGGVIRKLILFYITFGIFFLILPPVIIYLVLTIFIWIFKSVK